MTRLDALFVPNNKSLNMVAECCSNLGVFGWKFVYTTKTNPCKLLICTDLWFNICGERGSRTYIFKKYHKIANH